MKLPSIEETNCILPFESEKASLAQVGGKGANLARLARAGFLVPEGFLVTTQAYQAFLSLNGLETKIASALPDPLPDDPGLLEQVSAAIRELFAGGKLPEDLAAELIKAYAQLGESAVAVRSSATAEDLPEMSFAGQQDTYLNVVGSEALLKAVVRCWASLWTARAIGYRARNHLAPANLSLAVVVQRMVESQASGVLFTANPLTGLLSETVIDATIGLGEALVSGQVDPDHYVVDEAAGRITAKTLGAKAVAIRSLAGGGTVVQEEDNRTRQALPDEQILQLAQLGQRVAALYEFPQDIEWAWAQNTLYLLQSRPITSLFPLPTGMPPEPLKVLFSFAAVQGLLDPLTPLGRDMIAHLAVVGSRLFGIRVTAETQTAFLTGGERLWVNITSVVRSSIGHRVILPVLGMVEPGAGQAVRSILDDPRLQPPHKGVSPHALLQLARFFPRVVGNMLLNLAFPDARRAAIVARGERLLDLMRARCEALQGDRYTRLAQLAGVFPRLAGDELPNPILMFIAGVASGIASFNWLNGLSKNIPWDGEGEKKAGWSDLVLEIARGVPDNPTTEMDLALWQVALVVRRDPAAMKIFQEHSTQELARLFREKALPSAAQQAFKAFLDRYGGRGLGEIDAGRPRWSEEPEHIFDVAGGYLHIEDADRAPDAVFARGAARAVAAERELAEAVRKTHRGWLKAHLVRFAAGRARRLLGLRESPKFFAVRLFAILRQHLLAIGAEYVQAGELTQPDDLVYLSLLEMQAFASQLGSGAKNLVRRTDWQGLIGQRRAAYRREFLRRQVPRLLLSDGRAFYAGLAGLAGEDADAGSRLAGSPVSPGIAEGRVRVVFDPRSAQLLPGEILVCPGTDPSWTPLFLTAGGLVMEVGGMMTHGAVVAREYGIPAIVGVDQATLRLHTGQFIRIDGSSGKIELVEEKN